MSEQRAIEGPFRRRTEAERDAYIQGMRAGIKAVSRQFANQPGISMNHYAVSGPLHRALAEVEIAASFSEDPASDPSPSKASSS